MNRMASATPTCATVPRVLRVRMIHLGCGSGRQAARLRERGDFRSPAAVADVTVAKTVVATALSPFEDRNTGNECRPGLAGDGRWGRGDGQTFGSLSSLHLTRGDAAIAHGPSEESAARLGRRLSKPLSFQPCAKTLTNPSNEDRTCPRARTPASPNGGSPAVGVSSDSHGAVRKVPSVAFVEIDLLRIPNKNATF